MIETLGSLYQQSGHSLPPIPTRSWQPQSIADLDRWMDIGYIGGPTYSGKYVSPETAIQVSAVYACVQALSEDLASLPLKIYRRGADESRTLARDHYLSSLLRWEVNPEMTARRFIRLMETWLLLHGNAYAEIVLNGRGQVVELWPWRPDRVDVERKTKGGPLVYTYRMANGEPVSSVNIFHLRGLETEGVLGVSPITAHRNRIGMSMAVEEHGSRFFSNGARPLGVLKHPAILGDAGVANVRKMWEATHGGLSNAHRVAILEEGMDYKEVGISMVDAQYLEVMQFGVEDIARIYGVPPHRIGHLVRSTFNNIEHQGREYVSYSLGHHASNWETELEFSLLSIRERGEIYVKFNFDSLLRGDQEARGKFYVALGNAGAITPDEIREKEDMNPLPDGMGSKPRVPLNTIPADQENPKTVATSSDEETAPKPKKPRKTKERMPLPVNGYAPVDTALVMQPQE